MHISTYVYIYRACISAAGTVLWRWMGGQDNAQAPRCPAVQFQTFRSLVIRQPVCCGVLQCVAVCDSVLQCVAVCCSVLQCVAVCCSVWQCVAVCCSVLQCVAVCCSVLHCIIR